MTKTTFRSPLEWETYFKEQELKIAKERSRNKKIYLIAGILCLVLILGCSIYGLSHSISYSKTLYAQVKSEERSDNYTLISDEMANYLNEKYETQEYTADMFYTSEWYSNTGAVLERTAYKGSLHVEGTAVTQDSNVWAFFTSNDDLLFMDDLQLGEVESALAQKLAAETGFSNGFVIPAVLNQDTYTSKYREMPWMSVSGHHTRYDGNLEEFFSSENQFFQDHKPAKVDMQAMRTGGAVAAYFGDEAVPTFKERIQNNDLAYLPQYETGIKKVIEKYNVDILSCILPMTYYSQLEEYFEQDIRSAAGSLGVFEDTGNGTGFYSAPYTLASYAYDTLYEIKAYEVDDGIYLVSDNGVDRSKGFHMTDTPVTEELQAMLDMEYEGWDTYRSFEMYYEKQPGEGNYDFARVYLILDREKLGLSENIGGIQAESRMNPFTYRMEDDVRGVSAVNYSDTYLRDGYCILPPINLDIAEEADQIVLVTK